MSHRLRAGFLFESLLSFKEKKIKPSTCYIHLSEHLMYQLMMLLYKKKSPPTAWNGCKLLLFFAMFWY